jgi:CO/xanthine dehydrogenase Mo-binding subunit
MKEVGRAAPMREAEQRVRGTLPFAVNLEVPGMLHGKILRSTSAHGILRRVDASAAEAAPGVIGVLTGPDLLGGEIEAFYGPVLPDRPLVAIDRVRYAGEPVAAVIATDVDAAARALRLIEVEIEELPVLQTVEEATAPDAPDLHEQIRERDTLTFPDIVLHPGDGKNVCNHFRLRRGDVQAGFAEADEIFEDVFRTPAQQHCNLEPHVTIAEIDGGRATIWTSAASPYTVRFQVAETLRLPQSRVRVVVSNVGGAYGSKTYPRLEPLVAAMSWKVGGRPVRVELTRAEEFFTITRHAATVRLKTGVRRDGTIVAREVRILWNAGAYADISPRTIKNGGYSSAGPYRIPHVAVDSYAIYTNTTPAGGFRGYAIPQVAWAYEGQLDLIASRLGIDPLELRLLNVLRDGDEFATGQVVEDFRLGELLERTAERIGWGRGEARREGHLARGKGLACIVKTTVTPSGSTATLRLDDDGSLSLLTSTVEIGQGSRTVLAQLAADAVGVPVDAVEVPYPDTDVTPWDQTTSSSRSTLMMGGAVAEAGQAILGQLRELGAELLEAPLEVMNAEVGLVWPESDRSRALTYGEVLRRSGRRQLTAYAENRSQGGLDPETGQGIVTPHFFHSAAGAEVEVDLETGLVRVRDLHVETYAGRVVNPTLAALQSEGNLTFGVGQALFEEIEVEDGQIVNPSLADYNIPSLEDLPSRWSVGLLEDPSGEGRIHGLGETGAPAVPAAIGNAVYAATGVRVYSLPITPEKVLEGLDELAATRARSGSRPAPSESSGTPRGTPETTPTPTSA